MDTLVFKSMASKTMAERITRANQQVIVVAPALREETSRAIVAAHRRLHGNDVLVIVDCNEDVFRLGYGDTRALRTVIEAGCNVRQCAGLRAGVLICDDIAWVYSPTALYVQPEVHSDETPNAVELVGPDVARLVSRLWTGPKLSISNPPRPEAPDSEGSPEIGQDPLTIGRLQRVETELAVAPPIPFDIARQVRVFSPYILYVDIQLTGCAIQRKRIVIPKSIQGFAPKSEIEARLRTTFDLIDRTSKVSAKLLEDELRKIREDCTRSLGEPWGRVMLRSTRCLFDHRIGDFRKQLETFKRQHRAALSKQLSRSLEQIVEYYHPRVKSSPPDGLKGQVFLATDDAVDAWLRGEMARCFPTVDELLTEMRLEVQFRDVTYETLRDERFKIALEKAFPLIKWDKPFAEFKAAAEGRRSHSPRADSKE